MTSVTIFVCFTLCVAISAALIVKTNTDDLVAVVQIFRHGERTPVSWYANDPWKDQQFWNLEAGELTQGGKKTHYELGQFTRGRYGKFFPQYYYRQWFRAQTTDVDRTHMSCQSNLAAFFNPNENETWYEGLPWQPIPIHPVDARLTSSFTLCPIYTTEMAKILVKDPLYIELNNEFADLYTYLSNYTGENITSVLSVASIQDTIEIEDGLGFELPSWTSSVYPEPMSTLSGYAYKSYSFTTEMKRLAAGAWLKTAIYDYFSGFFNGSAPSQIFQMWSAHDLNIASILNTLGAFDKPHQPAFTSTLYFELRNNSGSPFINIYYRDDWQDFFEPITISGCSFNCYLDDFKTVLSDYLIDLDTWDTECAATSTSFTDSEEATSDEEIAELKKYIEWVVKNKHS